MVVTFFPCTLETGVMQERAASPLMCTVQAPQSAMPQPNLVPVRSRVSRNTQSSGICGSTLTVVDLPLSVNVVAICPLSSAKGNILQQVGTDENGSAERQRIAPAPGIGGSKPEYTRRRRKACAKESRFIPSSECATEWFRSTTSTIQALRRCSQPCEFQSARSLFECLLRWQS